MDHGLSHQSRQENRGILSDVEYPDSGPTPEALAIAADADLLIHDAMYSDDEYGSRRGWGHSSWSAAIEVAERACVKKLAMFHHSPDSVDEAIDAMVERATEQTDIPLFAAFEGPYIEL